MIGTLDRLATALGSDAFPVRVRVWLALVLHAADDGRCWPGVPRLAKMVGSSRRVIQRNLRDLEACGLLARETASNRGGRGNTTVYVVAPAARDGGFVELMRQAGENSPQRAAPGAAVSPPERAAPGDTLSDEKGGQTGSKGRPNRARKGGPPGRPNSTGTVPNPPGTRGRADLRSNVEPPDLLAAALGVLRSGGLEPTGTGWKFCQRLQRPFGDGLTLEQLAALTRAARAGQRPVGLLLHWLDDPRRWRDVLLDLEAGRAPPAELGQGFSVLDAIPKPLLMAPSVDRRTPGRQTGND